MKIPSQTLSANPESSDKCSSTPNCPTPTKKACLKIYPGALTPATKNRAKLVPSTCHPHPSPVLLPRKPTIFQAITHVNPATSSINFNANSAQPSTLVSPPKPFVNA